MACTRVSHACVNNASTDDVMNDGDALVLLVALAAVNAIRAVATDIPNSIRIRLVTSAVLPCSSSDRCAAIKQ